MLLKKYKINDNLNYYFHSTKKFKSFSIKIYFLLPYDKNKITIRNLLKDILFYDTKKYSKVEIADKKQELYNLKVSLNNSILTNYHQYALTISGVNPKFFCDEEYTIDKIFEYVNEIIFNPNIENNIFNEESFNTCLNRYKVALKTALEDKNFLAVHESMNLRDDDINKYSSYGYLEDFSKITNKELYEEYLALMNSEIIIAAAGDIEKELLKKNLKKYFSNFNEFNSKITTIPTLKQKYKEKIIKLKTEQSLLLMTFASEIKKFDKDYFDLLIFNYLFGGDSNSKLFQVLREEAGFCYEVFSSIDPSSGIISVYVGLDEKNIDDAIKIIFNEIKNIQEGNFSMRLMKDFVKNEYIRMQNIYDNIQSTLDREVSLTIFNRDTSLKVLKDDLNKVSKESVQETAKKVQLINTLIIKPKGENYENN